MKQKIILYASVGNNVPTYLIGGGETGTRRTIQILNSAGYDTEVIDKAILGLGLKHYIRLIFLGLCKTVRLLNKDKTAFFFVVGYYERNLWFEWLLLLIARLMGHKCIYEARNGRLVTAFNKRGKIYQYFMLSLLKRADLVLCQGQEYVDFIKKRLHKDSIYVPNYIMEDKIRPYENRTFEHGIRLVYSGRLVESKNIGVMVEVVSILKNKGFKVHLDLLGGGQDDYLISIKNRIKELRIEDSVSFAGHVSFDKAIQYLRTEHFFLFPSQEIKEGHSNSLTEAMAFGIVPFVSTAGFSASIVNNEKLVVKEISAEKYADRIISIIKSGEWEKYSLEMYDRALKYFRESIIREKILNAVAQMRSQL